MTDKLYPNYPQIDENATGRQLRQLCRDRNLKPEYIADYLGFNTERTVYKWYSGRCLPSLRHCFALSRLLGVSIDDIVIGMQDKTTIRPP